jgi:hypothetical protein
MKYRPLTIQSSRDGRAARIELVISLSEDRRPPRLASAVIDCRRDFRLDLHRDLPPRSTTGQTDDVIHLHSTIIGHRGFWNGDRYATQNPSPATRPQQAESDGGIRTPKELH